MPDFKMFAYWFGGGIALFALARPYPDLATALVLFLMFGVVMTHLDEYLTFFSNATPPSVKKK
jgi:hypothetical protein